MAANNIKNRIYRLMDASEASKPVAKTVNLFLIVLILFNVVAVILETERSIIGNLKSYFVIFEVFSVAVFTIEYILRIWSAVCDKRYRNPILGRLRFIITPMAIIDLLAILPFYLPMFIPLDLRFLRALRLIRLFRIFKLGRYSDALRILGMVVKRKKEELFITVAAVMILIVITSSLMYFIEKDIQPNAFSSIPAAMWWGIVTLSTVGYGDVYPITFLGKFLGLIVALLGIGMFALPAGILGSGFVEEIQSRKQRKITCPYCGKDIDWRNQNG